MPRRTVTVAPGFDTAIRSLQMKLMKARNGDVTYTEALNIVLLRAFVQPGRSGADAFWKEEGGDATKPDLDAVLDGYDPKQLGFDGNIDIL